MSARWDMPDGVASMLTVAEEVAFELKRKERFAQANMRGCHCHRGERWRLYIRCPRCEHRSFHPERGACGRHRCRFRP